jgi:hypothetical protein
MRLIPIRLMIVNLSLALASPSIWAQDNPISALFGAAKQMMPSSSYKKNTRLTRHQNPRQINNRILGQVNRTAGRLVKAALYTPIETIHMIGNNIVNAKNNRAGRRYYQAQNQFDPTARRPVLATNTSRRSETYTGQDIHALGKKNHLLNKALPKTKQHHKQPTTVMTQPQSNEHSVSHLATAQTKPLSTDNQNTPTVRRSPASLELLVPVNTSSTSQSKPNSNQPSTSDLLTSGTIINPPNNAQKTSSTVPYHSSEDVQKQTIDTNGTTNIQNPQINAPIKPYEICPKPNINQN